MLSLLLRPRRGHGLLTDDGREAGGGGDPRCGALGPTIDFELDARGDLNDAAGFEVVADPVEGHAQLAFQEQYDFLVAWAVRDSDEVRLYVQAPGAERRRSASRADK